MPASASIVRLLTESSLRAMLRLMLFVDSQHGPHEFYEATTRTSRFHDRDNGKVGP